MGKGVWERENNVCERERVSKHFDLSTCCSQWLWWYVCPSLTSLLSLSSGSMLRSFAIPPSTWSKSSKSTSPISFSSPLNLSRVGAPAPSTYNFYFFVTVWELQAKGNRRIEHLNRGNRRCRLFMVVRSITYLSLVEIVYALQLRTITLCPKVATSHKLLHKRTQEGIANERKICIDEKQSDQDDPFDCTLTFPSSLISVQPPCLHPGMAWNVSQS